MQDFQFLYLGVQICVNEGYLLLSYVFISLFWAETS